MSRDFVLMKNLWVVLIFSWLRVLNGKADGVTKDWLDLIKEMFENKDKNSGPSMVLVTAPHPTTNHITPLDTSSTCSKIVEGPIVCKEGFVLLESNTCYFFSKTQMKWHEALRSCESLGTALAYPLNAHENTVLVDHLKTNFGGNEGWWLGGSDDIVEGRWLWAHSRTPIGYTDWSVSQPDDAANSEDCLHLYKLFEWKWNDVNCNFPYNYICQQ